MKLFKFIVAAIVVVLLILLGFSVIGLVYSAMWYLFWIGVIAIGGYVGYKVFLEKDEKDLLNAGTTISDIELEKAKKVLDRLKEKSFK
ncbi:MAG: hypothetical protein MUC29_01730 [Pyrinomonadaceae bacterium]|jgi:hypothetical protein|nr:hypothetical protein [Pyrinomonadaceae bacterium]